MGGFQRGTGNRGRGRVQATSVAISTMCGLVYCTPLHVFSQMRVEGVVVCRKDSYWMVIWFRAWRRVLNDLGVRFYLFTRSSIGLHKRTGFLRAPIYLRVDGTGSANVVKLVVEGV